MSRYISYLNTASEILRRYDGTEPFAGFLKNFFSDHKKYGSKDRKQISHLCYCYFRPGKALQGLPIQERITTSLFLCSNESNELLAALQPEWNDRATVPFSAKCSLINKGFSLSGVFPWKDELSAGMDVEKFNESFFIQPDLFLRLRPGKEEIVKEKLGEAKMSFEERTKSSIALPNATKIDAVINLNNEAVVQDYSSQRAGEFLHSAGKFLQSVRRGPSDRLQVWDCCAGSGGKSIMVKDILGEIDLTVSDIRESILVNLKKRFAEAGIKNHNAFTADFTAPAFNFPGKDFDLIIADVPCTGSGTWSRTPEQLFYFDTKKTGEYVSLQQKIISNVVKRLAPGGFLLYITCSVFKKENEEQVDFINKNFHLIVKQMEVLKGYDKKADSMFAALLEKPL